MLAYGLVLPAWAVWFRFGPVLPAGAWFSWAESLTLAADAWSGGGLAWGFATGLTDAGWWSRCLGVAAGNAAFVGLWCVLAARLTVPLHPCSAREPAAIGHCKDAVAPELSSLHAPPHGVRVRKKAATRSLAVVAGAFLVAAAWTWDGNAALDVLFVGLGRDGPSSVTARLTMLGGWPGSLGLLPAGVLLALGHRRAAAVHAVAAVGLFWACHVALTYAAPRAGSGELLQLAASAVAGSARVTRPPVLPEAAWAVVAVTQVLARSLALGLLAWWGWWGWWVLRPASSRAGSPAASSAGR